MHVLGRDEHNAGADGQVHPHGTKDVVRLPGVVGAEALHVVGDDLGRGHEPPLQADVAGAPHADEARLVHLVDVTVEAEQLDDVGQAVGVAARDLDEAILARHQGGVVDLADVELAETEVRAPHCDEAGGALHAQVPGLVPVGVGGAIHHHPGPLQRLIGVVSGRVALAHELLLHVPVHAELGPASYQALHLGPLVVQR